MRKITFLVWIAALALGMNATRVLWEKKARSALAASEEGPIFLPLLATHKPYTVRLKEIVRAGVVQSDPGFEIRALSGDGSNVRWIDRPQLKEMGESYSQRFITTAGGLYIRTDELLERRSTLRNHTVRVEDSLRDPRSRCLTTVSGKRLTATGDVKSVEQVAGYTAVRIRIEDTDQWLALDLSCALLKQRTSSTEGISEQAAVSITSGEPDPALFAVPERFEEVAPSVLFRMERASPKAREQYDRLWLQGRKQ